jgi:hypothetical protein
VEQARNRNGRDNQNDSYHNQQLDQRKPFLFLHFLNTRPDLELDFAKTTLFSLHLKDHPPVDVTKVSSSCLDLMLSEEIVFDGVLTAPGRLWSG